MRCDLHLHSMASDGAWSPQQLAAHVAKLRLQHWALTDHDTLAGYDEIAGAPHLIPGVECSVRSQQREYHLVALGVQPDHAGLRRHLATIRDIRRQRAEHLWGWWQDRALVGAMPVWPAVTTRHHLAAALVTTGAIDHARLAYPDWLGPEVLARLPLSVWPPLPEASDTVRVILGAGGVALLAHPGAYLNDLAELPPLIAQLGVDGCEGLHPGLPRAWRKPLRRMAQQHHWQLSCGSDHHGHGPQPSRIGQYSLGAEALRPLLRALHLALPSA